MILPTEGWTFQKNKKGVTHITGIKPYLNGFNYDWADSNELRGIPVKDIYSTERGALLALRDHQAKISSKAYTTYEKAENILAAIEIRLSGLRA